MTIRSSTLVATALFGCLPAALSAQAPDAGGSDSSRAALIGVPVRVTTTTAVGAPVPGELRAWDAAALVVAPDSLTTRTIPLPEVVRLEVYRGEKRHTVVGVLIGSAAGILTGLVIASNTQSAEPGFLSELDEGLSDAGYVLLSTVIGATVGGFVGSRIRSPKWEEVSLSTGGR